jgi:hypothetical protein
VTDDRNAREDIAVAIGDLFMEKSGPGYEWLADVAARFVMLCSLGIESTSGEQIRRNLRNKILILDTDVVISLFCEIEPDHESVKNLVSQWKRLGSQVLSSAAVTLEVANHAWNADIDYKANSAWLPGKHEECRRLCETAFLREFARYLRKGKTKKNHWNGFINHYRGDTKDDDRIIRNLLAVEYKIGLLDLATDDARIPKIKSFIINAALRREDMRREDSMFDVKIIADKAERDAYLLASALVAREKAEKSGSSMDYLLVSSGDLISKAAREFRFGEDDSSNVLTIGLATYLLTFIPGVNVGLSALRILLFDSGAKGHTDKLLKMAMRIVGRSGEYNLPWAKRGRLDHNLGQAIKGLASEKGVSEKQVHEDLLSNVDQESTLSVLAKAIDATVPETKTEKKLLKRIAELEDELDKTKNKKR